MSNLSSPASNLVTKLKTISTILFKPESKLARLIDQANKGGDVILATGTFRVTRYADDADRYDSYKDFYRYNQPYSITEFQNGLLLTGVQAMYAMIIGAGTATANTAYATPTYYSSAQACIGVGDSSTAFVNTQTGLSASTNKAYEPMMSTFPSIGTSGSANVITFQSSFNGTTANYAWNEFCVFNSPADTNGSVALGGNAIAMNRAVNSQGTKGSGATWQCTYTLTLT